MQGILSKRAWTTRDLARGGAGVREAQSKGNVRRSVPVVKFWGPNSETISFGMSSFQHASLATNALLRSSIPQHDIACIPHRHLKELNKRVGRDHMVWVGMILCFHFPLHALYVPPPSVTYRDSQCRSLFLWYCLHAFVRFTSCKSAMQSSLLPQ
jgi:hypothetical protein